MACYGIPKPADATPVNIIWPAFDELLEDQRQAFDDMFALDDMFAMNLMISARLILMGILSIVY
jgi:hypothetical protein